MRLLLFFSFLFFGQQNYAQQLLLTKDTLSKYVIASISVQGNKKTKDFIIKRELCFTVGDTIALSQLALLLERSRQNVFNTTLFTKTVVVGACDIYNPIELHIVVDVHERWYAIPTPIVALYDRNYKVWSKVYDSDLERVRLGVKVKHINATGRRDEAIINLSAGFTKEFLFQYNYPYLDKKLRWGAGAFIGGKKLKGASYIDSANAPLPRKLCMTCPTPDFNLFIANEFEGGINIRYSKKQYDKHNLTVKYVTTNVSDTIIGANQKYFANNSNAFSFMEMKYTFDFLKVDYFSYPSKGYGVLFTLGQRFAKNGLNQTFVGLNFKWEQPLAKKLYYFNTGGVTTRFYNKESYYNLRTTNTASANIRGYEQYLFVAKSDVGIRNNIVYEFFNRKYKIPFKNKIANEFPMKLYARTFFDLGYFTVPNPNYNLFNKKLITSGGIALDIVTLFDYALRIELSYNKHAGISFFMR